MSDGIVQKAFKPYLFRNTRKNEFLQLQQELIEKIKPIITEYFKKAGMNGGELHWTQLLDIQKLLIGDNQE